jgi:hypothetical protein
MKEKQMNDEVEVSVLHLQHSGGPSMVYVQDEVLVPRQYLTTTGAWRVMVAQWREYRGTDVQISLAHEDIPAYIDALNRLYVREAVRRGVQEAMERRDRYEQAREERRLLKSIRENEGAVTA